MEKKITLLLLMCLHLSSADESPSVSIAELDISSYEGTDSSLSKRSPYLNSQDLYNPYSPGSYAYGFMNDNQINNNEGPMMHRETQISTAIPIHTSLKMENSDFQDFKPEEPTPAENYQLAHMTSYPWRSTYMPNMNRRYPLIHRPYHHHHSQLPYSPYEVLPYQTTPQHTYKIARQPYVAAGYPYRHDPYIHNIHNPYNYHKGVAYNPSYY